MPFHALGGIASISDIKVQYGPRGVAMAVLGNSPFQLAVVSVKNSGTGTLITLRCPNASSTFPRGVYSTFPQKGLFQSISVEASKGTLGTDIVIMTAQRLNPAIESRQKENQWLLLLSQQPSAPFVWQASLASPRQLALATPAPVLPSVAVEPEKKEPAKHVTVQKVVSTPFAPAPAKISPPGPVPVAPAPAPAERMIALKEIKAIARPSVQTLFLEFDGVPSMASRYDKKMVTLAFSMAKNSLPKAKYVLDKQSFFQSIQLSDTTKNGKKWLIARVNLKNSSAPLITISGKQCFLTLESSEAPGVSLWSATNGSTLAYTFAVLPSLPSPLPQIGKKVTADEATQLTSDKTFEVRKGAAVRNEAAVAQTMPAPPVAQKPLPPPVVAPKPVVYKTGIVIKDSIYLRSRPASTDKATIIRPLGIGTKVTLVESKSGFTLVRLPDTTGWIKSSFVPESSIVTQKQWQTIIVIRQENVERQQKAQAAYTQTIINNAPPKIPAPIESKPALEVVAAKVVPVPVVNKRHVQPDSVRYKTYGRDPFVPLSTATDEFDELGNVDNMNLVGILFDKKDRVALLEDKIHSGKAYALREGDQIRDGKVLKIEKTAVLFLLNEYGISHTIVRNLDTKRSAAHAE